MCAVYLTEGMSTCDLLVHSPDVHTHLFIHICSCINVRVHSLLERTSVYVCHTDVLYVLKISRAAIHFPFCTISFILLK